MRTNCKNCGAPLEIGRNKCPYCGTCYYDLSCIPLGSPFYLTVNVGSEKHPQLITAKVITNNVTTHVEPYDLDVVDMRGGHYISRYCLHRSIEMEFYVMEDFT